MSPNSFANKVNSKFSRFIEIVRRKFPQFNPSWKSVLEEKEFKLHIEHFTITIPIPFFKDGVMLIDANGVERPINNYYLKQSETELTYLEFMLFLLTESLKKMDSNYPSNTPFLLRIAFQLARGNAAFTINRCQTIINDFINKLPLHETSMKSWAVNNRLCFIDPEFEKIRDPNERLHYQIKKNEDYFERGWTSIGLSESALADNNYLLKVDLKKTIPFGRYHNPQRNLFQTLSMKGEELPLVTTKTALELEKRGIRRTGFNLLTAFVDLPLNFEDQLIADNSLRKIMSYSERRFHCFEKPLVEVGDKLKEGDIIAVNKDGEPVVFDILADFAEVINIIERKVNIGGEEADNWIVVVKLGRYLKPGSKFTNLHGNKGVANFKDLGVAVNPKTGEELKLQMIVSASSVKRRKNFGQILEALTTAIYGKEKRIILKDDYEIVNNVEETLELNGYPEDGCWVIKTPWGEFEAVVGWVFWGLLKDPEDNTWTDNQLKKRNSRGLLENSLKFSHIEFRALITRFGPKNPIVKEILKWGDGIEDIKQFLRIINSCRGIMPKDIPIIQAKHIKPVDNTQSMLVEREDLKQTVCDGESFPFEFALELPIDLFTVVPDNMIEDVEITNENVNRENCKVFRFNKIFIPYYNLRQPWKHSNGKFGLNPTANMVNRIIQAILENNIDSMIRHINIYFNSIAKILSTKRGEIAQKGMGVRYPFSNRGTAVLEENLPKNTVQIHSSMAKHLKVKSGDICLIERFPCLGFMSIRPQKVLVTDDEDCKYIIKVSGNSLVSLNLDFDGDTLFIASFHSKEAKRLLKKEWSSPNPICYSIIEEMNSRKIPQIKEFDLKSFEIRKFDKVTLEQHSKMVERAVGVKSHTGPVIALCYNLMRITERSLGFSNTEISAQVEKMLDKIGNSVFSQKHGVESLQEVCTRAICEADFGKLVELGFDPKPSRVICDIIVERAKELGITNLKDHYQRHKETGRSNIINLIVRNMNKIYFASRANLAPPRLIEYLMEEPCDLPSHLFKTLLKNSKRNKLREIEQIFKFKMEDRHAINRGSVNSNMGSFCS